VPGNADMNAKIHQTVRTAQVRPTLDQRIGFQLIDSETLHPQGGNSTLRDFEVD
jgi:hypothetical protein